jgi:hypothetical protein
MARIRVQHEIHSRIGLTRSSGIRGGSQSVIKRIESYHAINSRIERRALAFRGEARDGFLGAFPFGFCLANQVNNSRACRLVSFLTFRTASSTALMMTTLRKKLLRSKRRQKLLLSLDLRPCFTPIDTLALGT